jgi:disulfide bond formation protein DsbB
MIAEPRHVPLLVLVASIAILGGAFAFQHFGGLDPCVLCVWQRYPYGVTIAASAAAILVAGGRGKGALLALCGLAFLAGAGVAAFHVGVEQHWWQGTAQCAGGAAPAAGAGLSDLLAQAQAGPAPRCDEVPWSLFGVSMAGYNLLLSLALAAASLYAAARLWGSRA